MTRIKLCGLTRPEDIAAANALQPEYIGFVFAAKSKRYVSREIAAALKAQLSPEIKAVGVFVNEAPEAVASLLNTGIIDIAQLHGQEDETYIQRLRKLTNKPLIQAFRVTDAASLANAQKSRQTSFCWTPAQAVPARLLTGPFWTNSAAFISLPEGLARTP